MAFEIDKLKTKYKNSALCLSENVVPFARYVSYTNRWQTLENDKKYRKS